MLKQGQIYGTTVADGWAGAKGNSSKFKKVADGWMDGWMDGWTDGRMDGWMDGRTDGQRLLSCPQLKTHHHA